MTVFRLNNISVLVHDDHHEFPGQVQLCKFSQSYVGCDMAEYPNIRELPDLIAVIVAIFSKDNPTIEIESIWEQAVEKTRDVTEEEF